MRQKLLQIKMKLRGRNKIRNRSLTKRVDFGEVLDGRLMLVDGGHVTGPVPDVDLS